eukprot:NODE_50_length_31184_cov_0.705099.p30 type:complete len:118 gc:universal NODE_50_length_31184_cov_0.705099:23992-23639(-)
MFLETCTKSSDFNCSSLLRLETFCFSIVLDLFSMLISVTKLFSLISKRSSRDLFSCCIFEISSKEDSLRSKSESILDCFFNSIFSADIALNFDIRFDFSFCISSRFSLLSFSSSSRK